MKFSNLNVEQLLYTLCEVLHTVKILQRVLDFTNSFVEKQLSSQIYALSSVKFLGLKLRLCKKKIKIRYAFTTPTSEQQKKIAAFFLTEGNTILNSAPCIYIKKSVKD